MLGMILDLKYDNNSYLALAYTSNTEKQTSDSFSPTYTPSLQQLHKNK